MCYSIRLDLCRIAAYVMTTLFLLFKNYIRTYERSAKIDVAYDLNPQLSVDVFGLKGESRGRQKANEPTRLQKKIVI